MFEIEDISLGHQELFTSKYSSAVNDYCSADMDLYLDTPDAFSLLDIEIKNEMEIVLTSQSEISYNFADVPDIDDCSGDPGNWFSTSSNHSNSNLFDFCNEGASRMVNPNSVMPLSTSKSMTPTLASSQNLDSESPSPKPSHLTFSPASVRISSVKLDNEEVNTVKKDLSSSLNTIKSNENNLPSYSVQVLRPKPIHVLTTKSMTKSTHGILNNHAVKISQKHLASTVSMAQLDVLTNNSRGISNNAARKNKKYRDDEDNPYPKPTYSYSCLIAMALKNSRTGSLPVSEIYNFMCEHFPYFKTAPTGWKNSVRHNLSLNKCFEKIEKPAVSGSQRKGCLWAMHPDKISKMDEEVQKWSRKDPAAIRRAMIYPDQLESLEKGELKYGSDNYLDADSTSESDIEGELEEIEVENHIILKEEDPRNDYVEINSIGDSYDEASLTDYDNDNPDNMYEELEVENEKDALRMEIALAQEELFKFDKNGLSNGSPSKRARSSTANVSEYVYQPISSGRRKAPLLVRNNSNTSFIEVTGE